jgi:hypothetical protein
VRRPLAVLTVLAGIAIIAAGSALAKGPSLASICGATGCVTLRGELAVQPIFSWWSVPFASRAAPGPAPSYSIRVRDPSGVTWVLLYVPNRHAIRIWQSRVPPDSQPIGPYWRTVPMSAEPVLRRLVRRVGPHAAPAGCHR